MKKFLQDNLLDNPFMLDTRRVFGFKSKSSAAFQSKMLLGLVFTITGLLCVLLIFYPDFFPIEAIAYVHLFTLMLVAPATCYMSYAAEVERRTWDFVMVSPVSALKILVGKLIPAIIAMCLLQGISILFYGLQFFLFTFKSLNTKPFSIYIAANLFNFVVGVFVVALVSLISLKSKRVRVASTNGFVATFALLFIWPLLSALTQSRELENLSPLSTLGNILNSFSKGEMFTQPLLEASLQSVVYLICATLIFVYIYRHVRTK